MANAIVGLILFLGLIGAVVYLLRRKDDDEESASGGGIRFPRDSDKK